MESPNLIMWLSVSGKHVSRVPKRPAIVGEKQGSADVDSFGG